MSILPPAPYPIPNVKMETWLIRFDENGVCSSPGTRDALLKRLADQKDRPVIFFSHGWNNDFADAVDLYRRFLTTFEKLLVTHPLPGNAPIFVGVTWPSIWLASDAGPQMAGVGDEFKASSEAILRELLHILPATTNWERLYTLLDKERLAGDESKELAGLLAPAFGEGEDGGAKKAPASEESIVKALADLQAFESGPQKDEDEKPRLVDDGEIAGVAAAGLFDFLDPRPALRLASLYIMKDRAGKVGSNGVAALLRAMLARTEAPIHVVGHSFGCKVMLSAAATAPLSRKLKSMLLLEPAISHLAFAASVPGRGGPGGYRTVLERVENPIFSTYSASDFPLHGIYHLALLRREDLGEGPQIAGGATSAGDPPNVYAALGGYGPRGSGEHLVDPIPKPGEAFAYPNNARLVGIDGSFEQRIDSHGGIATPFTAWALRKQMD
jgi:Serine hydrolase